MNNFEIATRLPYTSITELPDPDKWYDLVPAASLNTREDTSDWRSWPHLHGRHRWREKLDPPTTDLLQLLANHRITTLIFNCPICGQDNVDLKSHVLSGNHFKKLSEVMGEINVHVVENKYWHMFHVFLGTDTGGVAFNHVLGRIRMIRCGSSQPPFPPTPPPSVQRAVCHAGVAVPCIAQGEGQLAPVQQVRQVSAPHPQVESIHADCPIITWTGHLWHMTIWAKVAVLERLLTQAELQYDTCFCSVCGIFGPVQELIQHLTSWTHFRCLLRRIQEGSPGTQTWTGRCASVTFNHYTAEVQGFSIDRASTNAADSDTVTVTLIGEHD